MRASLAVWALVLAGCYDEPLPPPAPAPEASLNEALLDQAWTMKLDSAQARGLYDSKPGWIALYKQDAGGAIDAFSRALEREGKMDVAEAARTRRGLARAHLVLAAVLRQGALASAHAYLQSFRDGPREESDPVEVDYLLGVSHGILGDCSASGAALRALPEGTSVEEAAGAWMAWAAPQSGQCPSTTGPTEEGIFSGDPGPVVPGTRPEIGSDAYSSHFAFAHQGEGAGGTLKASDPTSLLVLAEWHVEAARQVAPEGEQEIVDALASLWRLPGRAARGRAGADAPLGWSLFGLTLAPLDIGFLNDAIDQGVPAIGSWGDRSLMASILGESLTDGMVDDVRVDELGGQLKTALMRELEAREGSLMEPHATTSDLAPLALLRGGMWVSEASRDAHLESAGRLGVMLYDLSYEGKPHKQLAQVHSAWVAWKAGTGNTHSSTFLHRLTGEFPELWVARYALDIMSLRIQANTVSDGATQ